MIVTPRSRRAVTAPVLLAALGLACAGPREPLSVGMAEHASSIVLGPPPVVVPEPVMRLVPPNALPIRITTPPALPPLPRPVDELPDPSPDPSPDPTPPTAACPQADPVAQPRAEALRTIMAPPAPATYSYRNDGQFEVSGANAVTGQFPTEATRKVAKVVVAENGSFTFDVQATLGETTTITTYRVVPSEGLETGGVYIARTEIVEDDETQDVFDPTPDLQLVELPITNNAVVSTVGVDPVSQRSMNMRSTVVEKGRTDACGELVDVFVLRADGDVGPCTGPIRNPAGGHVADGPCIETGESAPGVGGDAAPPGSRTTFSAEYRLATQFGGLIVEDDVEVLTEDPFSSTHRLNHATIDVVPRPAAFPDGAA